MQKKFRMTKALVSNLTPVCDSLMEIAEEANANAVTVTLLACGENKAVIHEREATAICCTISKAREFLMSLIKARMAMRDAVSSVRTQNVFCPLKVNIVADKANFDDVNLQAVVYTVAAVGEAVEVYLVLTTNDESVGQPDEWDNILRELS